MKQFQYQKIKEFREAAGMTQHDLADKLSLFPQQISDWECGRNLTIKSLISICKALDKEPKDFFAEG